VADLRLPLSTKQAENYIHPVFHRALLEITVAHDCLCQQYVYVNRVYRMVQKVLSNDDTTYLKYKVIEDDMSHNNVKFSPYYNLNDKKTHPSILKLWLLLTDFYYFCIV